MSIEQSTYFKAISPNICRVLNCTNEEIKDFFKLNNAYTNQSFHFVCHGIEYVYRHPGERTDKYLSRQSEAFALKIANQLDLDKTTVFMDEKTGWKIARFIPNAHAMRVEVPEEMHKALSLVRTLHQAAVVSPYNHFVWNRANKLLSSLETALPAEFHSIIELHSNLSALYFLVTEENVPKVLCHGDFFDQNCLIDSDGEAILIDWEYAGNDDPASDLGTFICCSECGDIDAIEIIKSYYGYEPSKKEIRHILAYVAFSAFYWLVWGIDRFIDTNNYIYWNCAIKWNSLVREYYSKASALYEA